MAHDKRGWDASPPSSLGILEEVSLLAAAATSFRRDKMGGRGGGKCKFKDKILVT